MTKARLAGLLALALLAPASARQPPQRQAAPPVTTQKPPAQEAAPTPEEEDEVVRITTNIVQLDADVTGKDGRQVTDLRAEDFEILEDGKPQQVTHFSYVSAVPASSTASPGAAAPAGEPAPPAPARTRRENVRRSIALVVDDVAMPADAILPTREALRKFVDQQVQQGDLVAIIRTGGQVGILQQFTADRRLLYEAISRVRPSLLGVGGMSAFEPAGRDSSGGGSTGDKAMAVGSPGGPGGSGSDSNAGGSLARDAASLLGGPFNVPALRALSTVIGGMRGLPGRKSLIFFSPGFILSSENRDQARRLAELANRASVVLYTVDLRGLVPTGPTAADPLTGLSGRQLGERLKQRSQYLYETQGGPQFLADETGGLAFKNSNDILPAARILEDLKGYYLIGYRPGGETFNRRFHKITVRVRNRPDLSVRTRTGFSGLTEEEARAAPYTSADRLLLALMSPFAAQEIGVQLTPDFNNLPAEGSYLRAMLHIDAGGLTFTPEADGWQRAELVIHGVLFGDNGQVAEEHRQAYTIRLRGDSLKSAQAHGLDYAFNMPARRPGAYQFRVALLDQSSSRVGSAGQPVEVPELKKDRIALSGIIVSGAGPPQSPLTAQAQAGAAETQDTQATPAVRRFRRDTFLDYYYVVFNPRADKATGRPRLSARAKLFRDGRLVFDGPEKPVQPLSQLDPARVTAGGRLQLGSELPPGEYFLQVVVTDQLAPASRRAATQWIDFEIVK